MAKETNAAASKVAEKIEQLSSADENKALVRRYYEEVLGERNLTLFDELYAPDYVIHYGATNQQWPQPSREGLRKLLAAYLAAYPDLQFTIEDQIAEGDRVVTRVTTRGTHIGLLMGIPATGKYFTAAGITIDRIAGGKIVESWGGLTLVNWL